MKHLLATAARPLAAALAVALAVALGGCNVSLTPSAATVNGSVISESQLDATLSSISSDRGYLCLIGAGPGGTQRVVGAGGSGTFDSSFVSGVLSILIQYRVASQEVARLGLSAPPALSAVASSQLAQAFASGGSTCTTPPAAILAGFSSGYRSQLLQFQLDQDMLAAHSAGVALTPAGLAAYGAAHPGTSTLSCLSVIVVKTRALASSIRAEIARGTSFATLARTRSVDTQSAPGGGAIGCVGDSQLNPPLGGVVARLGTGQVSPIVAYHSLYLLMKVTSRRAETYAELVSVVLQQEAPALARVLPALIGAADVTVDPQYGSWAQVGSLHEVKPHNAPAARFLLDPGALQAPLSGAPSSGGSGTVGGVSPAG